MSCDACLMRRGYYARKTDCWEGFNEAHRDRGAISEWAFVEVKESYEKVASEDVGRLSIVQDILRKSTDFLRIIALASGVGGVTLSYVCPHSCASSSELYEHNVASLALEVIGQNWSGEMVSLFLEDWEIARVVLNCHLLLCDEPKGLSSNSDEPVYEWMQILLTCTFNQFISRFPSVWTFGNAFQRV